MSKVVEYIGNASIESTCDISYRLEIPDDYDGDVLTYLKLHADQGEEIDRYYTGDIGVDVVSISDIEIYDVDEQGKILDSEKNWETIIC